MKLTPTTERLLERIVTDFNLSPEESQLMNSLVELVYINGSTEGGKAAIEGYKEFLAQGES